MTDYYYYVIPRTKANYSVAWTIGKLTTTLYGARLGGIPNYDGDRSAWGRHSSTTRRSITASHRAALTFTVDNLFDSKPAATSHLDELSVLRQPLVQPGRAARISSSSIPLRWYRQPLIPPTLPHDI